MKKLKQLSDKQKLLIISIALFVISLTQRTYSTGNDGSALGSGFLLLTLGWLGVFVGGVGFCWLANPLVIFSWILVKKSIKTSMILSGIATIISFSFLFFDKILVDEAGHYGKITGYYLGYWLWAFSSLIMFVGSIWIMIKQRKNQE